MLWLFDEDRLQSAYLPEAESLITIRRYDDHSEWTGKFPVAAYEALDAATFAQAQGEEELYLVESVDLLKDKDTGAYYVSAGGRDASALLDERAYVRLKTITAPAGEAIRQMVLSLSLNTAVPWMTSDTTPSGTASASSVLGAGYEAFRSFDESSITGWHSANTGPPFWLRYDFPAPREISAYAVQADDDAAFPWHPVAWVLQGSNDGTNWTTVDSRSAQSFSPSERKLFEFTPASFRYWYFIVTTSSGAGTYCRVNDLGLLEHVPDREIPGLVFGGGATLGDDFAIPTDLQDMGQLFLDAVQSAGLGFTCTLSGTDIVLTIIEPTERDTLLGEKHGNATSGKLGSLIRDWKNYAYVTGTSEYGNLQLVTVDWTGTDPRREIVVESGIDRRPGGVLIPEAEYNALLAAHGARELANHRRVRFAEAETDVSLDPGDVVWHDASRYSASLMVSEVETVRERGITRTVTLGQPLPSSARKILRRLAKAR